MIPIENSGESGLAVIALVLYDIEALLAKRAGVCASGAPLLDALIAELVLALFDGCHGCDLHFRVADGTHLSLLLWLHGDDGLPIGVNDLLHPLEAPLLLSYPRSTRPALILHLRLFLYLALL